MNKLTLVQNIATFFTYWASPKISFLEKFVSTGFTLAYIISPIDLIPDIPVIGWIDDIGVGVLFLAYCAYRVKNTTETKKEPEVIDVTPTSSDTNEHHFTACNSTKNKSPFFSFNDNKTN